MKNTKLLNEIQHLSKEELTGLISHISVELSDPHAKNQNINVETKITRSKDVSKYRPKRVNSYGTVGVSYVDRILEDTAGTPYGLLKELQSNREQFSNISYIDITGKDIKNFSRHIAPWLNKDLIVAIKTKEQFDDITLASMVSGIPIDINPQKGRRYFMFNPSLLLPYSRMDKGKHFDFIYLIYQYLKSYVPPAKSAYQDCHKKHKDAMVKEYFKDSNQCTFDEFLDRSKEYINLCLAGKQPVLDGWFKLVEEQSKDKSIKL